MQNTDIFLRFSFVGCVCFWQLLKKHNLSGCEDVDVSCKKPIREYKVPEVIRFIKVDPNTIWNG